VIRDPKNFEIGVVEVDIRLRMLDASVIPDQFAATVMNGSMATQPMNSFTRKPFSTAPHAMRNDLISVTDGVALTGSPTLQQPQSYSVLTRDSVATAGHLTALSRMVDNYKVQEKQAKSMKSNIKQLIVTMTGELHKISSSLTGEAISSHKKKKKKKKTATVTQRTDATMDTIPKEPFKVLNVNRFSESPIVSSHHLSQLQSLSPLRRSQTQRPVSASAQVSKKSNVKSVVASQIKSKTKQQKPQQQQQQQQSKQGSSQRPATAGNNKPQVKQTPTKSSSFQTHQIAGNATLASSIDSSATGTTAPAVATQELRVDQANKQASLKVALKLPTNIGSNVPQNSRYSNIDLEATSKTVDSLPVTQSMVFNETVKKLDVSMDAPQFKLDSNLLLQQQSTGPAKVQTIAPKTSEAPPPTIVIDVPASHHIVTESHNDTAAFSATQTSTTHQLSSTEFTATHEDTMRTHTSPSNQSTLRDSHDEFADDFEPIGGGNANTSSTDIGDDRI